MTEPTSEEIADAMVYEASRMILAKAEEVMRDRIGFSESEIIRARPMMIAKIARTAATMRPDFLAQSQAVRGAK